MRHRLLAVVLLVLTLGACEMRSHPAPRPDPEFVTFAALVGVQINIGEYSLRHGDPPSTLADVCVGELARYCLASRPDSAPDGWGMPLAYTRNGGEYELRSGGADRRMHTADDMVVHSARVRDQIRNVSGCYAMPAPRHGRYPARQVRLDSATSRPGVHRVRSVPSAAGQWYPLDDVVVIDFLHGRFVIPFVLRREGEDLVGVEGSHWAPLEPVVLRRIPCTGELA